MKKEIEKLKNSQSIRKQVSFKDEQANAKAPEPIKKHDFMGD
jgi:hypothetical protein